MQCLPVDYLLKHNADMERRIRVLEQRLKSDSEISKPGNDIMSAYVR